MNIIYYFSHVAKIAANSRGDELWLGVDVIPAQWK